MLSKLLRSHGASRHLRLIQSSLRHHNVDVDTGLKSIAKTMQAVRCNGIQDYAIETLPTPELNYGEMLVEPTACGICGSDCKCYYGAPAFWEPDFTGQTFCEPPVTIGHEFVGTVVALADGCDKIYPDLKLGDQVCSQAFVPCNECFQCKRGNTHLCSTTSVYGFSQKYQGALATYMKYCYGSKVHKVSNKIKPEHAAYAEPLACATHAVNRADIQEGDIVVVAGSGPIGLGALIAAKSKKPKQIIQLDGFDWKLDIAREIGAAETLNYQKYEFKELVNKIYELTDGRGCDRYIEASGNPLSFTQGVHMLRRAGTMSLYSIYVRPVKDYDNIDLAMVSVGKELDIKGGRFSPGTWDTAIKWIEDGTAPVSKIIGENLLPLDDWKKGLDMVGEGDDSIKVMIKHDL